MDYVENQEVVVEDQQVYYSGGAAGGPPSVPRPWIAQWAEQESTWVYINEETGERSWEVPFGAAGGGYQQETTFQEDTYQQDTYQRDSYQQDTVYQQDTFQEDTYRQDSYQQETFQEDTYQQQTDYGIAGAAAAWTGEKVGEVEYEADRVKNDVENIPEDIAGWVGEKVGGVERFGAEVDGAYDVGRAEGRDGW